MLFLAGVHAEVQAVNSLLNSFPELEIKDITVSTFRLNGSNEPFNACRNCSGILKDVNIVTGRVD